MKHSNKYILAFLVSLLTLGSASFVSAQEHIYPVSIMDVSPRAAAMGGLTLGEATSDYLHTNPAAFVRGEQWVYASVSGAVGSKLLESGRPYSISSSVGVTKWGVGLMAGIRYKAGIKIPKYDPSGVEIPGKFIHQMDRAIDFGVAYNPIKSLPLGFYAKYAYYLTAYGRNAVAHSFTVGASYQHRFMTSDGVYNHLLTGTVEVSELGRDFSDGKTTVLHLPSNVAGALSWNYVGIAGSKFDTTLGVQGRYFFKPEKQSLMQFSVGGEVMYNKLLSLQIGYQYAWRDLSFVGCGLGVKLPYFNIHFGSHISLAKDMPRHNFIGGVSFEL